MKFTFKEVSDERYDEMLGAVPPALWIAHGFLVGEAESFRRCTIRNMIVPTYAAFLQHNGKFYEGNQAMTFAEFRKVNDDINGLDVCENPCCLPGDRT